MPEPPTFPHGNPFSETCAACANGREVQRRDAGLWVHGSIPCADSEQWEAGYAHLQGEEREDEDKDFGPYRGGEL